MTDNQKGTIALVAGSIAGIITMALHPTGNDLTASGGHFAFVAWLTAAVHVLGIVSLPAMFLGGLALSQCLASKNRLSLAALVVYGVALAAGMIAATLSGFVAPSVARSLVNTLPTGSDEWREWRMLFHYTGLLNQAFARVLTVASSVAILLWSTSIVKTQVFSRSIGLYGLILGPVTIIAVLSGHLKLDVHGYGLVVLTQTVWFILVGRQMWQKNLTGAQVAGL